MSGPRKELSEAFAEHAARASGPADADDVMIRNAYILGAILMRDNIVAMFQAGRPMRDIRALVPPEPDVDNLRRLEAERRAAIAGN